MKIFGYEIFGSNEKVEKPSQYSFTTPVDTSSETIEEGITAGGVIGYDIKNSVAFNSERELINTYREIARSPEIGLALNEIRNETFIFDDVLQKAVDIRFIEDTQLSEQLQAKISDEFKTIYRLLDFNNKGNEYLESWYVDSRILFHKIIDIKNFKKGIQRVVQIDPLKIRKITEYPKADKNGIYDLSLVKEYYIYSDEFDLFKDDKKNQWRPTTANGLKIGPEYITYCDSGIYDRSRGLVLGYLDKTIAPYNNLKLMEESLLIYRVTRSPERRVFYIDVGNLPRNKAEQYLKELMNKFKSKLTYDSKTGTILDRNNALSMVEDYWLPRKSGGTGGTEIVPLPSGDNTGITADVQYFKEKFLRSLNIPVSRFQDESTSLNYGATNSEITRDEYRFKKFIDNLRKRFSLVFEDLLRTQLILKNIITVDEWDELKSDIQFIYAEDNNFVESKELEILTKRLNVLDAIDNKVGKYFSEQWVMQNILKMTEEQITQMKEEIANKNKPKKEEPVSDLGGLETPSPIEPLEPESETENQPEEPETTSKKVESL